MARKIKFALEMADGTFVSNLEDLQKHIKNNDDVKKLVEYFLDGRLEKWLLDRYYDEEAKALQSVDKNDPDFAFKFCKSIGVDYTPSESVNVAFIEYEKRMRKDLEEVTLDSKIIENAGSTASTQSDLDFLIKNGKNIIYLWGDSFTLPLVHNISYIGILGKPSVDIELVDLDSLKSYGIKFENLNLPEAIRKAEEEVIRRITEEARRRVEEEIRRRVEVGGYIKFGNYPQTANGDVQPIEWRVLAKENNKMLVVSKYGLESRRFDSSSNEWKNSEIRQWANNEFYNKAFNENDKKYIKSFDGDNLFLLSEEEAEKYFANDESRKCKVTEYALKQGADVADNGYSYWWLRSIIPNSSYSVYIVDVYGYIYDDRVYHDSHVFRPALWINL